MQGKSRAPWEIPTRGRRCARANELLGAGQEIYSEVRFSPEGEALRRDYCAGCWALEGQERNIADATYWRSHLPEKEDTRPDAAVESRSTHVLTWLRQALSREDSRGDQEAFILAWYLVRLRKLVKRHQMHHAGTPSVLFETVDTGEALLVPVVALTSGDAEILHQQIAERLKAL